MRTSFRRSLLVLGLSVVSIGAAAQGENEPTYLGSMRGGPGTANGEPAPPTPRRTVEQVAAIFAFRVPALPSRAVPERALSSALRADLARARAASRFSSRPPRGGSLAIINGWVQRSFASRQEVVREVSRALEAYATPEYTDLERVVAAVASAHLDASFAGDVVGLPIPREIAEDAELALIYRERIAELVLPVFQRAGDALGNVARSRQCETDPSARPLCDHARDAATAVERLVTASRITP